MNDILLKIKNFGPIQNGYANGDGYMKIPKVTLFCGPQGSGKSTIAKVLSSLIWLEKAAHFIGWKGKDVDIKSNKIVRQLFEWHGMSSYFQKNMEISYRGTYLNVDYSNQSLKLSVNPEAVQCYKKPKIMYVPAERNFLYLLDGNPQSKLLPSPMSTLLDEFKLAQVKMCQGKAYDIPANGYQYGYDASSRQYYFINAHSKAEQVAKTPAVEASSGLQSVLPLLLITDFLSRSYGNSRPMGGGATPLVLRANPFIYNSQSDGLIRYSGYNDVVQVTDLLSGVTSKNSHFVNVVEEPEQNLFPPTQRNVLRQLVAANNRNVDNRLVLSTHSPYVVADLVAAIKSRTIYNLVEKLGTETKALEVKALLEKCYPKDATVSVQDVCLYETSYDGSIDQAKDASGIPDCNFLNRHLQLSNQLFDELDNLQECVEALLMV